MPVSKYVYPYSELQNVERVTGVNMLTGKTMTQPGKEEVSMPGITLREHYAGQILASIIGSGGKAYILEEDAKLFADSAVRLADMLIERLEK